MRALGIGVVCLSGVGGSGIVAADVAAGMAARGHRVHLLSDKSPFRFEEVEAPVHLHAVNVPATPALPSPPLTMALANRLAELIELASLDVLHVHYAVPNAVAAMLARATVGPSAPPTVVTLHGTDVVPLGTSPQLARVTRSSLLDAVECTAPSAHLARLAERAFDLGSRRTVEVVPNFVDMGRFPPRKAGDCPRPFSVVHVSNFRPVKRAGDALEAFAKLDRHIEARLHMIGDGPERHTVEARAHQLGLGTKVRFHGVRHDIGQWLGRSDVALVPSGSESFGLSALEAMAAGLPVVASRVGGLPEVVKDGETGLLVDVGDVDTMAEVLEALARDPDHRDRLGRAGREDARRRFDPAAALDRYEAVLGRAVEERAL